MILRFKTKQDTNGNTYKLIIDTVSKQYAGENTGFFHGSDFITVGKKDLRKIRVMLSVEGYQEINYI